MICARKINKISEFYMIFTREMPEFYTIIARKIFIRFFSGGRLSGGGARASPVSDAYAVNFVRHASQMKLKKLTWVGLHATRRVFSVCVPRSCLSVML